MYVGKQKSILGLRQHSHTRKISYTICGMDDKTLPKPNGLQNYSMDHVFTQSCSAASSSTSTTDNALESVIVPPHVSGKKYRDEEAIQHIQKFPRTRERERADKHSNAYEQSYGK